MGLVALLAACSTVIERGLSTSQADQVAAALEARGIGVTTEVAPGGRGVDVSVLDADVGTALAVLRDEGLPRVDAPGIADAYAEPALVPTAGEERARLGAALAADLGRSIEAMPGVHDARVHLGMPDPSAVPMDEAPAAAVASVLVRARAGQSPDEAAIRRLVAGAVPGLAPERVAVVVTPMPDPGPTSEPLVAVGPIHVTQGSAPWLRAVLAGMLVVNVLAAVAVALVVRRRRGA